MAKRRSVCVLEMGEDVPESTCIASWKSQSVRYKARSWCKSGFSDFYLVLALIGFEVCKQTATYSLQEYNNGNYPIPSSLMVVFSEIAKLLLTILRLEKPPTSISLGLIVESFKFIVPGLLYALNNNIYFEGLRLVPPGIWMVLCSFRTAVTVFSYKFLLNRPVQRLQFVGVLCIIISIILMKMPDILGHTNQLPPMVILLSLAASIISVLAALYTETLFKAGSPDHDNFLEKQLWLYFYGVIISGLLHYLRNNHYGVQSLVLDVKGLKLSMVALYLMVLTFDSMGGLVVATVLKVLDNVVKEYSTSAATVGTAVVCAILFPNSFKFSWFIIASFSILIVGIVIYEQGRSKLKIIKKRKEISVI
ncbi:uncharacterized protein LOC131879550 isoform X2 [Tigriopus californicus]|uniref:uncharacterized protein LOC131879550 isoform X2 n=1 Tax=Tigriopus californicus TaxID=6832 RepID=UPI0027DA199B|nr:uncharacterized protein LOC131879550 isoform X2 [Tigriopus californicus]